MVVSSCDSPKVSPRQPQKTLEMAKRKRKCKSESTDDTNLIKRIKEGQHIVRNERQQHDLNTLNDGKYCQINTQGQFIITMKRSSGITII